MKNMLRDDAPIVVNDKLAGNDYRDFEAGTTSADDFVAALERRSLARLEGPMCAQISNYLERVMHAPSLGLPGRYGTGDMAACFVHVRQADAVQAALGRIAGTDPWRTAPQVMLDPVDMDPSGDTAFVLWAIAEDARHAAYVISEGGRDDQSLRVHDLIAGRDLPEVLRNLRFPAIAWAPDGQSFLYNRHLSMEETAQRGLDDPEGTHRRRFVICRHVLGQAQSADQVVADYAAQPQMIPWPRRPRGSPVEFLEVPEGADPRAALLWRAAGSEDAWQIVLPAEQASLRILGVQGTADTPVLFAVTELDAPMGRIVAIDLTDPRPEHWTTCVPEGACTLEHGLLGKMHLFAVHHSGTAHVLTRYDLDGADPVVVPLPGQGRSLMPWRLHPDEDAVYVSAQGRVSGKENWRIDADARGAQVVTPAAPPMALPDAEVIEIELAMEDGVGVPVSIVHPNGYPPSPQTPMLVAAYGGHGLRIAPYFDPGVLAFVAMGGAFAFAHIRGGGEKGRAWHEAGRGAHQPRSFADLEGVVDQLIDKGLASRARLAIEGASHGGLVVAAVMNRRPDLCAAVVCRAPTADMLRFTAHHAGHAWTPHYGDPANAQDAAVLRGYSPVHNVTGAPHPPILITTAENDDRVPPWHAFKLAAALINEGGSPDRVHLLVERSTGHGTGRSSARIARAEALRLSFLARVLDMGPPR